MASLIVLKLNTLLKVRVYVMDIFILPLFKDFHEIISRNASIRRNRKTRIEFVFLSTESSHTVRYWWEKEVYAKEIKKLTKWTQRSFFEDNFNEMG